MTEWGRADWMERGACRGKPTEWWFSSKPSNYLAAKRICETCPVIVECDQWAEQNREHGIWGGRARHLGVPAELDVATRPCLECGALFAVAIKPGAPTGFCSDGCREDAKRATQRRSARARGAVKGVYSMADLGHGRIARYNGGCRCKACRRVAKVTRRKYDRASA